MRSLSAKEKTNETDYGDPSYSLILESRNPTVGENFRGFEVGVNPRERLFGFHVTDKGYLRLGNQVDLPTYLGIIYPITPRLKDEVLVDEKKWSFSIRTTTREERVFVPTREHSITFVPTREHSITLAVNYDSGIRLSVFKDKVGDYHVADPSGRFKVYRKAKRQEDLEREKIEEILRVISDN